MSLKSKSECYSIITECRICQSTRLSEVLDLGAQPPANSLRLTSADEEVLVPLKLLYCNDCETAQINATVEPSYLFSNYVWVTGTSDGARDYSTLFSEKILNISKANPPFVVEIASNDGTFLRRFQERGCTVLGVDPAENIALKANQSGIKTLSKFFNFELGNEISKEYGQADIVIARNVMPHVKEIHSIIKGFSKLVNDDGIVAIEFHYAKKIIDELHYDSIYHEHLFYFSLQTISNLFKRYGLHSFDVFSSPISGGSLVILFSKKTKSQSIDLKRMLDHENEKKLNTFDSWAEFGKKANDHAKSLFNLVSDLSKKTKIIAYGASARSSTLLNFAKINSSLIKYVIDKNIMKCGLITPGTNIKIISYEEGIKIMNEGDILLLAWNFRDEIIRALKKDGFKGRFIIPLPGRVTLHD